MTEPRTRSKTPPKRSKNAPTENYVGGYTAREDRKTDKGAMAGFLDSAENRNEDGTWKKGRKMVRSKDAKIGRPTQRVRAFVEHIATGMTIKDAQKASGLNYGPKTNTNAPLDRPYVKDMVASLRYKTAEEHKITRAHVLDGLKEAIDLARINGDPAVMVAGWREIGKMCGFYEAVKVKVDVSDNAVAFTAKLMQMSDDDLLRLAGGETIDGELA